MTQSIGSNEQALKEFYKDIQKWIDSGFEETMTFSRMKGLCGNLRRYLTCHGFMNYQMIGIEFALAKQFKDQGLDYLYPFNKGTCINFDREAFKGDIYKNPERLNWIKYHAI